jgi:hypothetical protein
MANVKYKKKPKNSELITVKIRHHEGVRWTGILNIEHHYSPFGMSILAWGRTNKIYLKLIEVNYLTEYGMCESAWEIDPAYSTMFILRWNEDS